MNYKVLRNLLAITFVLGAGCTDVIIEPKAITVKTPDGDVVAHQSKVDSFPQQITTVTGEELAKLVSLAARSEEFLATYVPGDVEPTLKEYDRAFRAWQISKSQKHSPEDVVQILGSYLGNKCIADFDMEWVTVTDEYGNDYAVRGKKLEIMAFPFSTVLKRIENDEYDFLHGVYYTLKQGIESGEYKVRNQ